jgi:hypothetical protein
MSNTRLFRRPPPGRPQEEIQCFGSRLEWSGGTRSDALAARRVYSTWKRLGGRSDDRWARQHRVDIGALREIDDLVKDVHQRLDKLLSPQQQQQLGQQQQQQQHGLSSEEEEELLQVVLAGACYPRLFVGKAPKFLSIDTTKDDTAQPPPPPPTPDGSSNETEILKETTVEPVVEVVGAPVDATEATIGECMAQAGRLQRSPERLFCSREISHWRVSFQRADSWLSVPMALKIGARKRTVFFSTLYIHSVPRYGHFTKTGSGRA